jgi:hypothetical protein
MRRHWQGCEMKKWFDHEMFFISLSLLLQALGGLSYLLMTQIVSPKVVVSKLPTEEGILVSIHPLLIMGGFLLSWTLMTGLHGQVKTHLRNKHRERMSMKRVMERDGMDYNEFMERVYNGIDDSDDETHGV